MSVVLFNTRPVYLEKRTRNSKKAVTVSPSNYPVANNVTISNLKI